MIISNYDADLSIHDVLLGDDVVPMEEVRGHRVGLVVGEDARPVVGHDAADVVPDARRERPSAESASSWYGWAIRSRLEPVKKVARMIRRHWEGVINAVMTDLTNARSEGINAKIQWIKQQACGYRNRERFRSAIYFHLGGLDLYPDALSAHTNS